MAGNGPPPTGKAIRRNKQPEKMILRADGKKHGFKLPNVMVDPDTGEIEEWHPVTQKWWDAWRTSPQGAMMLSEPDWYFLLDTALIHHKMWMNGRWEFASEVRLRVAKFGATVEDRMKLRQEIEAPEQFAAGTKKGNVTSIDARRGRLTGT